MICALFPFEALLLAGGQSRRMGRDKALLAGPDGRPLWRWQYDKLAALRPAAVQLSRRSDQCWPVGDVAVVEDGLTDRGPLSGLAAGLSAAVMPRVLVLAVDLAWMTPGVLARLLAAAGPSGGAVFVRDGRFEPLAAVYPVTLAASARDRLEGPDFSLQGWLRAAGPQMAHLPVDGEAEAALRNMNRPADYAEWVADAVRA